MKEFFTLAICAFAVFSHASAQIKKGEKMLGGSFGLIRTSANADYPGPGDNSKTTSTAGVITPQFGFGLQNNWIVGVKTGVVILTQENDGGFSESKQRSYIITPGVFVRKYTTIGERFGLFGQGDVSYGFGKDKYTQVNEPTTERKLNSIGVSLKPGMFFRANRRFSIEATFGNFGYSRTVTKGDGGYQAPKVVISNLDISVTNGLSLGFQLVL